MRLDSLFHDGWEFLLSDSKPNLQTSWEPVKLPHDWSTQYPLEEKAPTGGGGGYAKAGIGWYKKIFHLEETTDLNASKLSLLFEGSYMDTSVYVNDVLAAHHGYGYTPFVVDLNEYLKYGDNTILVCVDNSHQPNSRWYSGSGIFRDIHFIITDNIHITPWGIRAATNGIYPDKNAASLSIQTEIKNESSQKVIAGVIYQILDKNQQEVSKAGTSLMLSPGQASDCQVRPELTNPHLWTVDDPYLYQLITTVIVEDTVVDKQITPIGIRTATFDCDRGFLLNQEPVKIKGVCVHHDCGLTGAVGYREVWERRLVKLKDMGCNGIRCAHNPPEPAFLDLCDQLGFLVMDEIFDEWFLTKHKNNNYYSQDFAYGSSMFFASESEENLVKMLRRDFNHPSVILWSIGNEIPEQSSMDGVALVKYLQGICHREDVSRMVTSACDNIAAGATSRTLREFENELDVVGYNYTARWRERAETFYDEDRHLYPKRRFCGSENPAVGGDRGNYSDNGFWGSYVKATLHHEALWRYTESRDFVAGDYLWTGFDYLGECRWPRKGAACGPMDTAGFEKDAFYYFRSIWNKKETTLHLLPHWNWSGEEGQFKQVICYTNCEEVMLYINDKLVGKKGYVCPRYGAVNNWYEGTGKYATTNDLHLTWDVPYEPGTLKAIGLKDGKEIASCILETTGPADSITAKVWNTQNTTLYQIDISTLDAQNRYVPDASNLITCTLKGPAHLIGMDNGNLEDLTLWCSHERNLFSGKLFALIEREQPGPIEINFTSPGLKSAQFVIE